MKMCGDIIPRYFEDYHLNFNFSPITFLDFDIEAKNIPEIIIETKELNLFNRCISILFSIFIDQAALATEQMEWDEADQKALDSLTPKENELLGLYLPIFHRYGDTDSEIAAITYEIQDKWNRLGIIRYEWVIFSPSYCLPTWFEHFYNSLTENEKKYLNMINPNKITIQDNKNILILLKKFKYQLE